MAKTTFPEIVAEYNKVLKESRRLDYFVRDKQLQEAQVAKLDAFRQQLKDYKVQAVAASNEDDANTFFHLQCVVNAQISALKIWILLKESNHHAAWNSLIDAQEYLSYALKTSRRHFGLEDFLKRLENREHTIFPGFPLYNSIGLVFAGGVCSICGNRLEECEHIEEKVYWGKVCLRIGIEKVEIDHSAIVPSPKDRRCITTEFAADDGFIHDYITWKVLRPTDKQKEKGRYMRGVMFSFKELDIL